MTNIFLFSKLLNINNIKSFNLFYMANLVQQGKQLYNIITPKRTGDIFSQLLYKLYPVKSQDPIEELCLKHNNNPEDKEQLLQIIKLLNYPCSQIAQLHMRANQLGTFDLSEQHRDKYLKSKQLNNNNKKISQNQQESDSPILKQFCPCCGYIVQECHINFFTPLKNVKNIGISTFLYFQTIINLTLLLLAMLVIGQLSSKIPLDQEEKRKYLLLYLTMKNPTITLANRSKTIFLTSNWVGFIIVFVWVLLYIFIKYKEGKLEFQIDNQSITASDFTLIFRDIPKQLIYSQMKQLDSKPKVPSLHEQIREYQKKVEKQLVKQNHEIDQKLKVEVYKIQQIIPFYLDESKRQNKQFLRRINKQYFKIKQKLIKMIKYRRTHDKFQQSDSKQRQNFRNKFVEQKRKRKQALKNQIYEKHVTEQNESGRMTVFVTFNSIHSKNFVEKFNAEQSYLSFFRLSRLEDDLKLKLKLPNGQEQIAQIQIAPEPEDIIWMNFGQRNKFIAQSIKTFVYAFLALCASCFIVYFCSAMKKSLCQKDEWKNKIGKWSISMVMSATNSIIREIMKRLTIKQRKETKTEEQKNLALKTIFITLINSIAMPIIVNELLAQKIQGKNGLQDDILGFAWSNALLTPFLKFIGSSCVFNVMWARYKNSPLQKLTLNQAKLNRLHQNPEFQIGYQYVHIISFYLFACFYASLNIKILYPAILGFVLMYYSQKFSLFNYYKRPTPGTIICNRTLFAFVVLGPALFSSANIIWSASSINPFNQNKLYDYSCFVLSLLILRIPYAKISEKISTEQIQTQALYEDKFPYLPANYTFSNPSASKIQINKQKDHRQLLCKEKKGEEEILVLSYYQVGKSPSKKMEEIKEIQKQMCFDIEKRKWNNQKFQQINSIKKKKI